jgi:hypothetical protein
MKTTLLAAVAAIGLGIAPAFAADMQSNSGYMYPDFLGHRGGAAGARRQGPGAVERCDYRHLRRSIESGHLAFPAQSQWGWRERLMCSAQRMEGAGPAPRPRPPVVARGPAAPARQLDASAEGRGGRLPYEGT